MPSAVSAACLALATVVLMVIRSSNATNVCPQILANDPNPRFCALNSYGQLDVTRAEFENWNCNHPLNKYVAVSQIACVPVPTAPTCTPDTCTQEGPLVCGQLKSPSTKWPNAYTTAVFGNQCQLTLYNCKNPTRQYVASTQQNGACTSIGFAATDSTNNS